jgi:arabinofuranosyltransferase
MGMLSGVLRTRFNLVLTLIVIELAIAAWTNRFIQDDAFISFRYADNLVNGYGLVWNPGERVEGYTNFLWTVAMSIPLYLRSDPVTFSFVFGIMLFICSLALTYKASVLICGSREVGLLTVLLLGTNYTFLSYATGGLETQLQACLFAAGMYIVLRSIHACEWRTTAMVELSIVLSLAMLTRPDSLLLLVVILPAGLFFVLRQQAPYRDKLTKVLALILPVTVVVATWTLWRQWYYGDLLPNTFYAKASSITSPSRGLFYVYKFLVSYLLVPFPLLCLVALKRLISGRNTKVLLCLALILLWTSYVVKVGGDFMEFRLLVPVMPLMFLVIAWLIFLFVRQAEIQATLFVLVLLGSLHHASTFGEYSSIHRIRAIRQLYAYVKNEDSDWAEIGRVLGRSFGYSPDVSIATTAAGAIPFYSRLNTIDMHGMNDRWVARYGDLVGSEPGHQRVAPFSYLLARRVNLVLGHPWMRSNSDPSSGGYSVEDVERFDVKVGNQDLLPPDAEIVEIPINSNFRLVALYLTRSQFVDEAVGKNGWQTFAISRD